MQTLVISSQGKGVTPVVTTYRDTPYAFVARLPSAVRDVKRLYLKGYAFYDQTPASCHTGLVILEVMPFRFQWQTEKGVGEARVMLPAQPGANEHWFDIPIALADALVNPIHPLTELEVRAWSGTTNDGDLHFANLRYLHLWLLYEK